MKTHSTFGGGRTPAFLYLEQLSVVKTGVIMGLVGLVLGYAMLMVLGANGLI